MTRRSWWFAALLIGALALAASANSLANGFAYDDNYVIVKAERTHTLVGWWRDFGHTYWPEAWGGDGYRPLTNIAFRLEWALGAGQPLVFHTVNVALHVITAVAVFWLACELLPFAAAWIAAALYAVHPVHVESIANGVGQAELVVALLVVLAVGLYASGRASGPVSRKRWLAIGALYAAACFFKEHAIVMPVLLLLAEWTVVRDRAPLRQRMDRLRMPVMCLAIVGLAYLWARSRVVLGGGVGFVPYLPFQVVRFSTPDRILTAIGVTPVWMRLFLWPARLAVEYSPQYVEIAQGPSVAQIPGILVLLGTLGLAVVCVRRSPVTTFGIGWMAVTLLPASNFLVAAGFIVAERTLLLPSVGVMLAVASAIPWLYERMERRPVAQGLAAAAAALLIALGLARSYTRNRVWNDSETLFKQGVLDAPDSYRAHYMLGMLLFERKQHREGEAHYRRAVQLFPYDPILVFGLAEQYRLARMCEPAIPLYRTAFSLAPRMRNSQVGLSACLLETLQLTEAKKAALEATRWGSDIRSAHNVIVAANAGRDSLAARRARGDTIPRVSP